MKRIVSLLVGLCLLVGFPTIPALADVPALPHAFYGAVEINGSPAPVGTQVKARGLGVVTGIEDNPTITTVAGIYGTSNPFEHRLIVQSDKDNPIEEGTTLSFYINGESTGQTAKWHTGEITELDLSVTIAIPGPGPGPGPTYDYTETNLFGTQASFRISSDGEILQTITATSADGNLTFTITEGTIALDKYGNPLSNLTAVVDPSPPDPPEDAHIIGLAYDFGPAGATFDPPITLEYTYDPADIPEGVAEEDLVLAYYEAGEWVALSCVVDPVTNTITASISHFTTFAIIGTVTPLPPAPAAFTVSSLGISPVRVNVGETVAISLVVTNTGGKSGNYTVTLEINGVTEADETVTIAAGDSQEVGFSVTKEAAGIYTVAVAQLSGSFTVIAPLAPATFSLSNLSVLPAEVEPNETVTITVSVTNTGGTQGSYTLVLKINGVKEADRTVTIDAGDSQEVSFRVVREDAGIYTVAVAQLTGSFIVEAPAKPPVNWPLIATIIAVVIALGLLIFFVVRRRTA